MIVSTWEGLLVKLLLGAAIDADRRGRYAEIEAYVEALLAWCSKPGITDAAKLEDA